MARRLSQLDYYALLGVPRDATVDAVKRAFHRFARRYHPDLAADDPDRREQYTRIYQRGTEAYRVLCHPEQRQLYDQGLSRGQLRFDPAQVRTSLQPRAGAGLARARPFIHKAQQSIRRGDYRGAHLHLKIAQARAPGDPTVASLLAEVEAHLA